jgi:hypothetical protein
MAVGLRKSATKVSSHFGTETLSGEKIGGEDGFLLDAIGDTIVRVPL